MSSGLLPDSANCAPDSDPKGDGCPLTHARHASEPSDLRTGGRAISKRAAFGTHRRISPVADPTRKYGMGIQPPFETSSDQQLLRKSGEGGAGAVSALEETRDSVTRLPDQV